MTENVSQADEEEEHRRAFETLQHARAMEAQDLFEQEEHVGEEKAAVDAPYDAGQTEVEALLDEEEGTSFTNVDEVEIADVSALDDPYESARVEGDLPATVSFEDEENDASV
ncbi:MAG: hypothetical protein ACPHFV_04395 [Poseidonia sp.]